MLELSRKSSNNLLLNIIKIHMFISVRASILIGMIVKFHLQISSSTVLVLELEDIELRGSM